MDLKNNSKKGISEAVTAILLVVIGIAMALMIWQFFTPKAEENLRIGPVDVTGGQVFVTIQNIGSIDAEITGIACVQTGSPTSWNSPTPLKSGGDNIIKQGETESYSASCTGTVGQTINVFVQTKAKVYGPFTVVVRS